MATNKNPLKLRDLGSRISSDKVHIIITDSYGKELYSGINPFKRSISPLSIQYIYEYMDRSVVDVDAGVLKLENGTHCCCIKIVTEPRGLFYTIEKTVKAERSGSRFIVSIYKNDKPLKTGLVYVNNGGEFNINKIDGLSIYENAEVKKIETSYNDKGYKEISFYI